MDVRPIGGIHRVAPLAIHSVEHLVVVGSLDVEWTHVVLTVLVSVAGLGGRMRGHGVISRRWRS